MPTRTMARLPAGDWISLREAADIIGCTPRGALNYVRSGSLPHRKIDSFFVVLRKDARAFVKPKRGRPFAK